MSCGNRNLAKRNSIQAILPKELFGSDEQALSTLAIGFETFEHENVMLPFPVRAKSIDVAADSMWRSV